MSLCPSGEAIVARKMRRRQGLTGKQPPSAERIYCEGREERQVRSEGERSFSLLRALRALRGKNPLFGLRRPPPTSDLRGSPTRRVGPADHPEYTLRPYGIGSWNRRSPQRRQKHDL